MIFFIDSNYNQVEDIKIYDYKIKSTPSLLQKSWLELIPLDNEKLIFCISMDYNRIECGLIQIKQNLNITVLKKTRNYI